MSRTRDQKRFTISEVAADCHELMIPQRTMRPSVARVSEQLDPRFASSRHTTAPINHTRPSPRSPYTLSTFMACTFFSNAHIRHSLLEVQWAHAQFAHLAWLWYSVVLWPTWPQWPHVVALLQVLLSWPNFGN